MPSAVLADRKSTRLNSSHVAISYAVFCLKKKRDLRPARGDRRLRPEAWRRLRPDGAAPVRTVGTRAFRPRLLHAGRQQLCPRGGVRLRIRLGSPPLTGRASHGDGARQVARRRRPRADRGGLLPGAVDGLPGLTTTHERPDHGECDPGAVLNYPGSDLLSHAVTSAVPSALEGLTSVFGMGTGVAPPASPPGIGWQLVYVDPRVQPSDEQLYECNVVKPHGRLVPLG